MTTPTMTVTVADLKKMGACDVAKFKKEFDV